MTKKTLYTVCLGVSLAWMSASVRAAEEVDATVKTAWSNSAPPAYSGKGTDTCLSCHNAENMKLIADTPHGNKSNPDTPFARHGCESCHGKGSLHVSRSMRGRGRPPMIAFGEGMHTPLPQQTQVCLGCHGQDMGKLPALTWDTTAHHTSTACINCHKVHAKGELATQARKQTLFCIDCHAEGAGALAAMEWQGSVHDQHELSCSDCHTVHTDGESLKNRQVQANTCFSCHEDRETEHPRFEDKFIDFDSLSCWACHDVHQLIPRHGTDVEITLQGMATSIQDNE